MDTSLPVASIRTALQDAAVRLAGVSDTPLLDAQVLLASLLNKPRPWLLSHPEESLDPVLAGKWQASLVRLQAGEPLPYVVGVQEFYNLEFEVSADVLIPRPETELLVERAIAWLKAHGKSRKSRLLDVGTGSGCIAIAVAANVPGLEVLVTDISPLALRIARRNAQRLLTCSPITFVEADLFPETGKPQRFDLVTANLPYIPSIELHNLPVSRHEPTLALDGGEDGLAVIRRFLADAPRYLEDAGLLLLEIEASQGEAAKALASESFPQAEVQLLQDLDGRDRLIEVHLSPSEEAA